MALSAANPNDHETAPPSHSRGVLSGSLKGLAFRARQASYHNDFSRDFNETRINVDYTLALW
ncbi:hypothetical protein D9M71_268440 [compost metagenome]